MKETPKDTIICYYYGRCKNHPIKKDIASDTGEIVTISSLTICKDSIAELAVDSNHIEQAYHKPIKQIKNHKEVAIDTIKDNVVSLINDTTYQTQSHSVRIEPINNVPMSYDIQVNAMVLVFTMYLTIKYAIDCVPHWQNLISDLKQEFSKA